MRRHVRGILDRLCDLTELVFAVAVIELVFLLISIAGLTYVAPGSAEFVIWLLNIAGLLVLLSVSWGIVLYCFSR